VWRTVNGLLRRFPAVDVGHPQISESLCRVAAKLALAKYYDVNGRTAGSSFRINTQWTHNQHKNSALAVHDLLKKFPHSQQLQQVKWDTSDSFFVRYIAEGDSLLIAVVLHEAVSLLAQLGDAQEAKVWEPWHYTWAPVAGKGIQRASFS
jgi:hypothetical protein